MNNEEKILSLLENMQGIIGEMQGTIGEIQGTIGEIQEAQEETNRRLDRVEQRLDRVEQRLDRVEQRLDRVEVRLDEQGKEISELKKDVSALTDRVVRIEIFQENTLQTRLDILYEGQMTLNEKMGRFSDAAESVERMREIFPVMESSIHTHTRQLAEHEKLLAAS